MSIRAPMVIFGSVFGLAGLIVFGGSEQSKNHTYYAPDPTPSYSVERGIAAHFFDPDSTKIRNLVYASTFPNGARTVCGEANGKNRFGGYVGWHRIAAVVGANDTVSGVISEPDFDLSSVCHR